MASARAQAVTKHVSWVSPPLFPGAGLPEGARWGCEGGSGGTAGAHRETQLLSLCWPVTFNRSLYFSEIQSPAEFILFYFIIEIQLIYHVVLVSTVEQSDSVILRYI